MDDLLDESIPRLTFTLLQVKKFLDDLFCLMPEDRIGEVVDVFDEFDINISFTTEVEVEGRLPFLDVLLVRENQTIITDWYTKPMASGRYLNYYSSHQLKHKLILITGMKNRLYGICDRSKYEGSLQRLKTLLIQNSYPIRLINRIFYNSSPAVNDIINNTESSDVIVETDTQNYKYYKLPHYDQITSKIISLFKGINELRFVRTIPNKLKRFVFTHLKDKEGPYNTTNVIYRIDCSTCEGAYIGQTGRRLNTRLEEHKRDTRLMRSTTGLARHTVDTGHIMNLNDVNILRKVNNHNKRLFLESAEINMCDNSVNINTDYSALSDIYCNILEMIRLRRTDNPNMTRNIEPG
ncbi:uncharacterized protein LOC123322809 [Coccinella septempunctata]|uniref:uncharacterized protein LOC123322809 n=1 Tax=Coccinella septempunctata TaxID=41139 RepID=UPI001D085397|nr:uncharacterized protein LOC123322809 [Coccinella septempunctata]